MNKSYTDVTRVHDNINMLRGIFSIFIIYTHCTLVLSNLPTSLLPLRKISTFGVGFFLVLSGYGLALSSEKKKSYFQDFLIRKILSFFVLAIVSRIISQFFLFFTVGYKMSLIGIFRDMNWYIYTIILLYTIFYAAYRNIKSRASRVLVVWGITILVTIILLYLVRIGVPGLGRSYYISEWAFPFGITIYEYRKVIDKILSNFRLGVIIIVLIAYIISFSLVYISVDYSIIDLLSHNIMLVPFYFTIILLCTYFNFNNKILVFLKNISLELYLYQFMILSFFKQRFSSVNVLYFIGVTVLTIVISWIMHPINANVTNKILSIIRQKTPSK